MNKERRIDLQSAANIVEAAHAEIERAKEMLETLRDEEQEYYDNMPESFQNGDKGSTAQAAIDAIESAISDLENVDSELDSVVGSISDALA